MTWTHDMVGKRVLLLNIPANPESPYTMEREVLDTRGPVNDVDTFTTPEVSESGKPYTMERRCAHWQVMEVVE